MQVVLLMEYARLVIVVLGESVFGLITVQPFEVAVDEPFGSNHFDW